MPSTKKNAVNEKPPTSGDETAPEGELFAERMIPVRICCTEVEIEKIADLTAAYYMQQAIMFYRVSDKVQIKHYDKKK
jgi:hypothetical protein